MWHTFWIWIYLNSPTVQAVCAALALLGLFLYVRYTKRMMNDSAELKRLTLTPYLELHKLGEDETTFTFQIVNTAAPAVRCAILRAHASPAFELCGKLLLQDFEYVGRLAPITKEEPRWFTFLKQQDGFERNHVYVVDCQDTAGHGPYQAQLLVRHTPAGFEFDDIFVFPDRYMPPLSLAKHRLASFIRQWRVKQQILDEEKASGFSRSRPPRA